MYALVSAEWTNHRVLSVQLNTLEVSVLAGFPGPGIASSQSKLRESQLGVHGAHLAQIPDFLKKYKTIPHLA